MDPLIMGGGRSRSYSLEGLLEGNRASFNPGVISGVMMVFMPTVSTFAISEFLTNNKIKLFGTIIQENINSSMWNYGSALALIMLVIIGITSLFSNDSKNAEGGLV